MSDEPLTVDDLVTGKAAESLGPGVIPTAAILIVETMEEDGPGIRYVRSTDQPTWRSLGMIRTVQMQVEHYDRDGWGGNEDDLS